MTRREYTAGLPTTLANSFNVGDPIFTITSDTNWPSSTEYDFFVTIDGGTAQEERVLCSARTGTSVTVATSPSSGRGKDGTGEKNHAQGATVWPSWSALDADEANEHINLTTGIHGYTATAAEINILDGAVLSTTELNYVDGVTSPIQTQLNARALLSPLTNAQTGTSYTLVLSDAGKYIEMNNASANALTVPPNSSVAFPIGTEITVIQTGAGATTITPGADVTVNYYSLIGAGTRIIKAQWSAATLIKRATNTWVLIGNLQ